jgi:ATP-dependent Clp protease ATP-binding subunit ClpA
MSTYERFTDRARKVMQLANQEAQRFNHEYIGTEHIALGLVKECGGVAAVVLARFEVDPKKIRLEVEKLLQYGPEMVTMGKLPQTPRAKKVIEYAKQSGRDLGHNYVGTEHILLGLLIEREGIASQVLHQLGMTIDGVKAAISEALNTPDVTASRIAAALPRTTTAGWQCSVTTYRTPDPVKQIREWCKSELAKGPTDAASVGYLRAVLDVWQMLPEPP